MNTKKYYLVRFASFRPQEDFHTFISKLSTIQDVIASSTEDIGLLKYKHHTHEVRFQVLNSEQTPFPTATVIQIDVEDGDVAAISLCRSVGYELQYRIFDVQQNYFYPSDPELKEVFEVTFREEAVHVFRQKKLIPKYYSNASELYVINDTSHAIELVNPYLFSYFIEFGVDIENSEELTYPVASNLDEFTAFYDEGLIPKVFYPYYGRRFKVINASEFDIYSIKRKVFIHPFFYLYNPMKRIYEPIAPLDSAIHAYADKVRNGESLDDALRRITSVELGYADDYVRAFVTPKIDFDRDKEGILTPRLYIRVYLNSAQISEVQKNKFQRKWTSLGENFH